MDYHTNDQDDTGGETFDLNNTIRDLPPGANTNPLLAALSNSPSQPSLWTINFQPPVNERLVREDPGAKYPTPHLPPEINQPFGYSPLQATSEYQHEGMAISQNSAGQPAYHQEPHPQYAMPQAATGMPYGSETPHGIGQDQGLHGILPSPVVDKQQYPAEYSTGTTTTIRRSQGYASAEPEATIFAEVETDSIAFSNITGPTFPPSSSGNDLSYLFGGYNSGTGPTTESGALDVQRAPTYQSAPSLPAQDNVDTGVEDDSAGSGRMPPFSVTTDDATSYGGTNFGQKFNWPYIIFSTNSVHHQADTVHLSQLENNRSSRWPDLSINVGPCQPQAPNAYQPNNVPARHPVTGQRTNVAAGADPPEYGSRGTTRDCGPTIHNGGINVGHATGRCSNDDSHFPTQGTKRQRESMSPPIQPHTNMKKSYAAVARTAIEHNFMGSSSPTSSTRAHLSETTQYGPLIQAASSRPVLKGVPRDWQTVPQNASTSGASGGSSQNGKQRYPQNARVDRLLREIKAAPHGDGSSSQKGAFPCRECKASCDSQEELNKHIETDHGPRCLGCLKNIESCSEYRRHIRTVHFKLYGYRCPCCNYENIFSRSDQLAPHLWRVHTTDEEVKREWAGPKGKGKEVKGTRPVVRVTGNGAVIPGNVPLSQVSADLAGRFEERKTHIDTLVSNSVFHTYQNPLNFKCIVGCGMTYERYISSLRGKKRDMSVLDALLEHTFHCKVLHHHMSTLATTAEARSASDNDASGPMHKIQIQDHSGTYTTLHRWIKINTVHATRASDES